MKKLLVSLLAVLMLAGCSSANENNSTAESTAELKVAATIFPLANIAANIGGDKVEVVNILPAGASPHTYDFSPSDVAALDGSQVVFAVGSNLDAWVEDLVANGTSNAEVYTVDNGIEFMEFGEHEHDHEGEDHQEDEHDEDEHHDDHEDEHDHAHEGNDPHYWLDAENGMIIAENIANKLVELDPENADYYLANLQEFNSELESLDAEIKDIIADEVEAAEMIVFHDSWHYFAEAYGLEVVGTFEPSPGKEPTPQYLEGLYEEAEYHGLTAVFSEPQLSSDALDPFVEDLGLSIFILDPLGGLEETQSYQDLLLYNAETIAEAL
jgi:zinc transport system substrate-binding protein